MNAPQDRVHIHEGASERDVSLAAELLNGHDGMVSLEGIATLIPGAREIRCEIAAPTAALPRCEEEYKVMVENAARALLSSRLGSRLPDRRLRWVVVEGSGNDAIELWREA